MKVIHSPSEIIPGPGGVCLAMGVFDGLHFGHQRVIGQACEDAKKIGAVSVVVTFDRHPNTVIAPQHAPPFIYPPSKKLAVIADLGVDTTCVIHFDALFSQMPGEQFVRALTRPDNIVRSISVGESFKFGHQRSGDVALLEKLGQELAYALHALPDVCLDGQAVSSTRIREAVRLGQLELAGQLLGRVYTLCGTVVAGAQVGRQLGFPTANLNATGALVPPAGVYAANALVQGKTYRAAVNIGHRPTVYASQEGLGVEAHLLDFDGNIYGQEIELTFLAKLRDEARFSSLAALQQQIKRDVAAARQVPDP